MSKYGTFRKRMDANTKSVGIKNDFIANSTASVVANLFEDESKDFSMALVSSKRVDGPDETIAFVRDLPLTELNFDIGTYFVTDRDPNKKFLVFEKYFLVHGADYRKYKVMDCNVMVGFGTTKQPAVYIGSMTGYKEAGVISLGGLSVEDFAEKPKLIMKAHPDLTQGKRFMAAGEAWEVEGIDTVSVPGIAFISAAKSVINKWEDDIIEEIADAPEVDLPEDELEEKVPVEDVDGIYTELIMPGSFVVTETEQGYFESDVLVDIISRNANSVEWLIPFGVEEVSVEVKQQGVIEKMKFKVVQ